MRLEDQLLQEYAQEDQKRVTEPTNERSPLTDQQKEIIDELRAMGYYIIASRAIPHAPVFKVRRIGENF